MRKTKKLLSVLLTVCMVLTVCAVGFVPASAGGTATKTGFKEIGDFNTYAYYGSPYAGVTSTLTITSDASFFTGGDGVATLRFDPSTDSTTSFSVDYSAYERILTWNCGNLSGYTICGTQLKDYGATTCGFEDHPTITVNGYTYTITNPVIWGNQGLNNTMTLWCPLSINADITKTNNGTLSGPVPGVNQTVQFTVISMTYMMFENGVTWDTYAPINVTIDTTCSHSTALRNHNYVSNNNGTHTVYCGTCGAALSTPGCSYSGWSDSQNGVSHQRTCSICGYVDSQGHTYQDSTQQPTCTTQGYTTHTCSVCGYSYTDSYVNALNHDWNYAGATFNWNGYECATATVPCSRGDTSTSVATTVTNTITTQPTCEGTGVRTYTASFTVDGQTYTSQRTETVQPLGHNYNGAYHNVSAGTHNRACERFASCGTYGIGATKNATEDCSGGTATCTDKPVCTKCSTAYGSSLGGHNWNYANAQFNWNGYACPSASIPCSRCDSGSLTLTTTVNSDVTTQPTCVDPGVRTYTASFTAGGVEYTSQKTETLSATGVHNYSAATVKTEALKEPASCTHAAVYYYSCSVCGAVEYNSAHTFTNGDPLPHEWEWVIDTEATCGAAGVKHEKCKNCEATRSENTEIPATGNHEFEWVIDTEATCGAAGVKHEKCKNCEATRSENTEIPATGAHNYSAATVKTEALKEGANCSHADTYYYSCSVCGAVEYNSAHTFTDGDPLPHEWEWVIDTEATCGAAGVKHEKCKNCEATQNENTEIPATGNHEFEWVVDTEPTCGAAGVKHEKCRNCEATQNENTEIPATGAHEFEWVVDTEATCGAAGVKHEKCRNCEATRSENTEIP
ncbi:MAG: hypothetical protein IJK89_01260, partial [Clostridia bacterium]|nr:hypothetical protein [Clostridia bacterium]